MCQADDFPKGERSSPSALQPTDSADAMRNPGQCVCIKCSKVMQNFASRGLQPIKGLAFITRGHYGSAYFDPMDASYLEISVCDTCVKEAEAAGLVYRYNHKRQIEERSNAQR